MEFPFFKKKIIDFDFKRPVNRIVFKNPIMRSGGMAQAVDTCLGDTRL
jgi:hypothetical protein